MNADEKKCAEQKVNKWRYIEVNELMLMKVYERKWRLVKVDEGKWTWIKADEGNLR